MKLIAFAFVIKDRDISRTKYDNIAPPDATCRYFFSGTSRAVINVIYFMGVFHYSFWIVTNVS